MQNLRFIEHTHGAATLSYSSVIRIAANRSTLGITPYILFFANLFHPVGRFTVELF
jgi:hypothetical protein